MLRLSPSVCFSPFSPPVASVHSRRGESPPRRVFPSRVDVRPARALSLSYSAWARARSSSSCGVFDFSTFILLPV